MVPRLFRASSGSDLASLKCKAELDGDEYVINGQKTWTTSLDPDWIFVFARTDDSGINRQEQFLFSLIIEDSRI